MLQELPPQLLCRCDGWEVLRPDDPGYTYDGVTNGMLGPYSKFRCGFVPACPRPALLPTRQAWGMS